MDFSGPILHLTPDPRPIPNIRLDGPRPNLWLLIPNVAILGVLAVELRNGVDFMILALMGLIAVFSAVLLARFLRPPRLSIQDGQLAYRYGLRAFRFPAADLADVHMQNGYVLLTLTDPVRVEPASMRERMRSSYQMRGFHAILPAGLFYLDQVNVLRSALGMPLQLRDPGGEQIDEFHQSIRAQRPLATQCIIAACVVVFVIKSYFEHSLLGGSRDSNIAWGANYGPLTYGGQWWRLITHMFLHGGLVHLGMNMYVFWDVGRLMERLVGRVALLLIYVISGMVGGLASAAMHSDVISIGASGAVFGVIGALFGLLLHDRKSVPPSRLKELRYAILVFIVLNFVFGMSIRGIDVAAHGGGAVAGLIAGLIIVPAQARGHWLRCALLAILGAAGIVLTLHAVPTPFSFDQRAETLQYFNELSGQFRKREISRDQFADKLETVVLPQWREMEKKIPNTRFERLTARQSPEFVRSMQLMQECFEDWLAALRADNAELALQAGEKMDEAEKIDRGLFRDEDDR